MGELEKIEKALMYRGYTSRAIKEIMKWYEILV